MRICDRCGTKENEVRIDTFKFRSKSGIPGNFNLPGNFDLCENCINDFWDKFMLRSG